MFNNKLLQAATFVFVVFLIAVLAWVTLYEPEDPCDQTRSDVGAAVLADQPGDQDALVNRAIIMRGDCNKAAADKTGEKD
jgi:hypothetical protein